MGFAELLLLTYVTIAVALIVYFWIWEISSENYGRLNRGSRYFYIFGWHVLSLFWLPAFLIYGIVLSYCAWTSR